MAAALPGGDPLAAALAAGETPSPDIVAAAGAKGTLRPVVAWSVFGGLLLGVVLLAALTGRTALLRQVPSERPPDVLVDRAQEALRTAGVTEPVADRAWGFAQGDDAMRWLEERDKTAARWAPLSTGRLGVVGFWYRQSPKPLASYALSGDVAPEVPPSDVPGMAAVALDERGRLIELRRVPAQEGQAGGPAKEPDWNPLFVAGGLDPAAFVRDVPSRLPPSYADVRAAWKGTLPELPSVPIRVEAAGYLGRPVYFKVVGPWDRPDVAAGAAADASRRAPQTFAAILILVGLGFALFLARRNLRSGRGDLRGATRMALGMLALYLLRWALLANHLPSVSLEFVSFLRGAGVALFVGTFVWLLYLALEPAVRRRWTGTLVSWSRLLAGRFRDPLVGRDLLVGGAIAVGLALMVPARNLAAVWLGVAPPRPIQVNVDSLISIRRFVAALIAAPMSALLGPMLLLFLILGLRVLLRRQWLAVTASCLVFIPFLAFGDSPLLDIPLGLINVGIEVFVLMRLGLHALIVIETLSILLVTLPVTTDPSAWYAGHALVATAIPVAVGLYGLVSATSGARGTAPAGLLD